MAKLGQQLNDIQTEILSQTQAVHSKQLERENIEEEMTMLTIRSANLKSAKLNQLTAPQNEPSDTEIAATQSECNVVQQLLEDKSSQLSVIEEKVKQALDETSALESRREEVQQVCAELEKTHSAKQTAIELLQANSNKIADERNRLADEPQCFDTSLSLEIDMDSLVSSDMATREQFEQDFKRDITTSLGLPDGCVSILSLAAGSVVVSFRIMKPSVETGLQISLDEVVEKFRVQVCDSSSLLYKGIVTSKADPQFPSHIQTRNLANTMHALDHQCSEKRKPLAALHDEIQSQLMLHRAREDANQAETEVIYQKKIVTQEYEGQAAKLQKPADELKETCAEQQRESHQLGAQILEQKSELERLGSTTTSVQAAEEKISALTQHATSLEMAAQEAAAKRDALKHEVEENSRLCAEAKTERVVEEAAWQARRQAWAKEETDLKPCQSPFREEELSANMLSASPNDKFVKQVKRTIDSDERVKVLRDRISKYHGDIASLSQPAGSPQSTLAVPSINPVSSPAVSGVSNPLSPSELVQAAKATSIEDPDSEQVVYVSGYIDLLMILRTLLFACNILCGQLPS